MISRSTPPATRRFPNGLLFARWAFGLALGLALATPALAETAAVAADDEGPAHQDLAPAAPSVEDRLAEIQRRVQTVVTYPAMAAARGVSGEARVSFVLGADGHPEDVRVARSSGSVALDRAAERAVSEAGRLPYLTGRITVPVQFTLRDEVAGR